jgi:hypothetical protein
MKQKYISTIIFTSKLENVNRHLTKENAYIHFAVSLLNSKHRQNNLCQVSDSKQSVTMRESIPSQPNTALSLSLSLTHTKLESDDNKYGTPVASWDEIGE